MGSVSERETRRADMSVWTLPGRAAALCAGLALALSLGSCGDGKDGDKTQTSATTPTTTAPEGRPLPAAWYEDPDGDLVPTAVELKIDTDPKVDECAEKAGCGSGGGVNALESSNTM